MSPQIRFHASPMAVQVVIKAHVTKWSLGDPDAEKRIEDYLDRAFGWWDEVRGQLDCDEENLALQLITKLRETSEVWRRILESEQTRVF